MQNHNSEHENQSKDLKLETVNVPQYWVWKTKNWLAVLLSNGSSTAYSNKHGSRTTGSDIIVGSEALRSGVHTWVLHVENFRRMTVGVCTAQMALEWSWGWESSGQATSPYSPPKSLGHFSPGDKLRLELDLNKGSLTFYRNGECAGTINKVAGTVYPYVYSHDAPFQVTVISSWAVMQQEDSSHPGDLVRGCSRVMLNTAIVLSNMMASTEEPSAALQDMCAAVIDTLLEHFRCVCEALMAHRHELPRTLVLALLDRVTRTQTVAASGEAWCVLFPAWLSCALACLPKLQVPQHRNRLLPRILAALQIGERLVHACPYLRCYQGAAMHSYALSGWRFSYADQQQKDTHLSIDHGAALEANWTLELVVMCACRQSANSQGKRVLADTRDFCIVMVPGAVGHAHDVHLQEIANGKDGDASGEQKAGDGSISADDGQTARTWFSDAKCPVNRWVLLSFVSKDGTISMFVDGSCVATVEANLTLSLQSIGACPRIPGADSFAGQVRECRVYDVARSQDDMCRCAAVPCLCECDFILKFRYTY